LQLLLVMDLLLKTSHSETQLELQIIKLLHSAQAQIYRFFTNVALKVIKTHFTFIQKDNFIENVTFMAQSISSSVMPP
jgi:hypothetical protein